MTSNTLVVLLLKYATLMLGLFLFFSFLTALIPACNADCERDALNTRFLYEKQHELNQKNSLLQQEEYNLLLAIERCVKALGHDICKYVQKVEHTGLTWYNKPINSGTDTKTIYYDEIAHVTKIENSYGLCIEKIGSIDCTLIQQNYNHLHYEE